VSLYNQQAFNLRGDPGLLSALGGAVRGFVSGGPVGAITGAVRGWSQPRRDPRVPPPITTIAGRSPQIPPPGYSGIPRPGGGTYPLSEIPGVMGVLQRALPGGATGFGISPNGGPPPQGYHYNKTGYWTAAGYVPPRSKLVRNRKRNISNGQANMRALRRIVAWDKADRKRRTTLKKIAR